MIQLDLALLLTIVAKVILHAPLIGVVALGRAVWAREAPGPLLAAVSVRFGSQLVIALAALAGVSALV